MSNLHKVEKITSNTKKWIFSLCLAMAFPIIAEAGQSTGLVSSIRVHNPNPTYGSSSGVVMFAAGSNSASPCAIKTEWAFSLSTETGKAMYDLLLSAAQNQLPVTVVGSNLCSAWSDRESPYHISIQY